MSETRLRDSVVERDAVLPYRGAEGLRITAKSRGHRGAHTYVVRAPGGDLCQLGEEEHFLLTMVDGKRSFREIEEEFHARFAGNLSIEHFQGFLNELRTAGIIVPVDQENAATKPKEPLPLTTIIIADGPAEDNSPADPAESRWADDVVPTVETLPSDRLRVSLAPLFLLLARLGSPLRYFAWFLIPAIAAIGVALYLQQPRMVAALGAFDVTAPGVALGYFGVILAALLAPSLARGAAAAFHGAPRETFHPTLVGHVVPGFTIDRGWIGTLSRKGQVWSYGAPLVVRLAEFVIGASIWVFSHEAGSPLAIAGLLVGGVGLWSFLLSATPLWAGDGRCWLAAYLDEPALDNALWSAGWRLPWSPFWRDPQPDLADIADIRGRGFLVAAALVALVGIGGALLLWGGATWDALALVLGAARDALSPGIGAARDAVLLWLGDAGEAITSWISPWLSPGVAPWLGLVGGTVSSWVDAGRDTGSSWLGAVADATSRWLGAMRDPRAREVGAVLLGSAYVAALVWLIRAKLSVEALRPPERPWDGAALRRGLGELPTGRDGVSHDRSSLDERMFAGAQYWPSNGKILVVAAIIIVGLSVAFLSYPYESGGTFTILPSDQYELRARVSGEIAEVLVSEGQQVTQGQLLATLADWGEVHNLAVAKAGLEKAVAQLQDLLTLPKPEQVAVARQQFEQASTRLPFSKADYERDLVLVQTGAVSVRQFEQTQSTYEQDKAAVAVTKANYELVRVGATQPAIEAARAAVRLATAQSSFAEDQLGRTRIRAAAAGTVVTPNPQLMKGKYLKEGDLFVQIQDHRIAHVEVQVPETDIREIRLDGRVRAKAWGYEHKTWIGKVTLIASDAQTTQAYGTVVRVVADIPNPDGLLRPHMSGYAKVQTAEMPVWESFSRALVRFLLIEIWSWVP